MNLAEIQNPTLRNMLQKFEAMSQEELIAIGLTPKLRDGFLKNVVVPTGSGEDQVKKCWGWKGMVVKNPKSRGIIYDCGTNHYAYRVAYGLYHHRRLIKGKVICHRCPDHENPICSTPLHLHEGSIRDNFMDLVVYGTMWYGDKNGSRTHPEARPRGIGHPRAQIKDPKLVQVLRATYDKVAGDKTGVIAALAQRFSLKECVVSSVVHRQGRGYAEIKDAPGMALDISELEIHQHGTSGDIHPKAKMSVTLVKLYFFLNGIALTKADRLFLRKFVSSKYKVSPDSLYDIARSRSRENLTKDLHTQIEKWEPFSLTSEFLERVFVAIKPLKKPKEIAKNGI